MKLLVFAGAGHAHLHCLAQLQKEPLAGCRTVLISPSRHQYYSGMLSGFAEGRYGEDEIRIDLPRFAAACGADYIEDAVVAIDPENKELTGRNGTVYRYDAVSFDIGSADGTEPPVPPVKPNHLLAQRIEELKKADRPVIVGGGAAGTELAFSLYAVRREKGLMPPVLLSSDALLAEFGSRASRMAETLARAKGLPFRTGSRVAETGPESVTDDSGHSFPQTGLLWLTGPVSFPLFAEAGLPVDDKGFLLVDDKLQSVSHPAIFGAGDCVTLAPFPALAKNGVHAVRQGPVLWQNMKAHLFGGELQPFTPQKRTLAILSTGDGEALLAYGGFVHHGKLAWKWKERIDRKFIEKYKRLSE